MFGDRREGAFVFILAREAQMKKEKEERAWISSHTWLWDLQPDSIVFYYVIDQK